MHFSCPYLNGEIELTEERQKHIEERHPELLPEHIERIRETLAEPDQIRRSARFGNALLFNRWFDDIPSGKHIVVVVMTDLAPSLRHWVITAYLARKLTEGDIVWKQN